MESEKGPVPQPSQDSSEAEPHFEVDQVEPLMLLQADGEISRNSKLARSTLGKMSFHFSSDFYLLTLYTNVKFIEKHFKVESWHVFHWVLTMKWFEKGLLP